MSLCRKCQGNLEQVGPPGMKVWFCRPCRIAHDGSGTPLIENPQLLKTSFDALKIARQSVTVPGDAPAAMRLALEAKLIQGLQEAYLAGLKDGILLALHLDYEDTGLK